MGRIWFERGEHRRVRIRMNIIADTCFWIVLYDARDSHHKWAKETWNRLQYGHKFLIPCPTMYEFIDTRFEKDKENLEFF